MKTVNMNEILKMTVGDALMSSQTGFVLSASASVDEVKRSLVKALHEINIYNENEVMLSYSGMSYTSDTIDNVAVMVLALALTTNSGTFTIWFENS